MDEITNFTDFICNVKNIMKSYFYPKEESDDKYSPKNHTHPIDDELKSNSTNPVQNKIIKSALDNKANTNHEHVIDDVEGLQSDLDDKADVNHNHNTLYYGKNEIDTKLNGKSNTNHNHDDRYYTESEINTKLNNKSDTNHNHDNRYYTESEVDTKLNGKSNTNHNHNGVYPSSSEFNQLKGRVDKNNNWRVRLIRCTSNGTPYPADTDVTYERDYLEVSRGDKLGVKIYSDSNISLKNKSVRICIGSTTRLISTDANGYSTSWINLNNGVSSLAYAILRGDSNYYKATDMMYIEYTD